MSLHTMLGRRASRPASVRDQISAHGSPLFRAKNAEILAGAVELVSFEGNATFAVGGASGMYVPLDSLVIKNDSNEEVEVRIDNAVTKAHTLLAHDSFELDDEAFRSFVLYNAGSSTIAANVIVWTAKLKPRGAPRVRTV